MAEIKHVRCYPTSLAGLGLGASWSCIGGKASEEAWKEMREGQETRFQGNKNGAGESELLPLETQGIAAETITGPAAAFKVDPYILKAGETLLTVKATGRLTQAVAKAVAISIGGASEEGQEIKEKEVLIETLNGWASMNHTEADVKKLNEHPKLLKEFLLAGACDWRIAKAKKVKCFTIYVDLEISVVSTASPLAMLL